MSRLDHKEFEALMAAIDEGKVEEPTSASMAPVMAIDLTSQTHASKRRLPGLDAIDDRIAARFGAALGARLRVEVRASAAPPTFLRFADIAGLWTGPTALGILALGPGRGMGLLSLELGLARTLVACALGDRRAGKGAADAGPAAEAFAAHGGGKELTCVEKAVLRHLLGAFADTMAESWRGVVPLAPEILRFETDPRRTRIAEPAVLGIVSEYQLLGAVRGHLRCVIPFAAIEAEKDRLLAPGGTRARPDRSTASLLSQSIAGAPVQVRAELGQATVSLRHFLGLKIGDVLTLDQSEAAPIKVLIEGQPKMTGWPKELRGSTAIEIALPLHPDSAQEALPARPRTTSRPPAPLLRQKRSATDL